MSNIQSYNALIDRFHAFASGHFILKRFSHGQIEVSDLEKFGEYPFMHVVPSSVSYAKGMKTFSFQIVLADLPRDKEDKPEYQREVLSDLQRIAEDLVAEITNHRMLFGDLITVQNVTLEPFLEEFQHTLTGWTISLDLLVPYYWDACSIPAAWNDFFESGSGGTGSILTFIDSINRDNNGNVSLVNDEETPEPNYYYGTNDEGVRGWYLLEGGGLTCETIGDCQTIIDMEIAIEALDTEIILKADITSISAVGFSNDYDDLDNKPTIPSIAGLVPDTRTISTTAPLSGGGDLSANKTLSIPQATTSVDGYLSATDWTTFNAKQAALGFTAENTANKQNSLATDGTGVKFPTVDAVNTQSMIDKGRKMVSFFTDFLGNSNAYDGITPLVSGGIISQQALSVPGQKTNQQGVHSLSTSTVATNWANHVSSSVAGLGIGVGVWNYESSFNLSNLSDVTNRFRFISGFGSASGSAAETDGVFITYDEGGTANGTAASPNWQCVTVANSVRTLTTTATAVTNAAWNKLRIEINAAGTSVTFYVNGTAIATHTTNIPLYSASRFVLAKQGIFKTIGTTNRVMFVDYLGYENILTTSR